MCVPSAGEEIVSGSAPGIPCSTYRSRTTSGVSRLRPVLTASASRAYCDWAHVSGLAEPAGWPGAKPIEAVAGSDPNGEAASAGSSHACSGSRYPPEVIRAIALSSPAAAEPSPAAMSYSPRSPASTGHRWSGAGARRRPRRSRRRAARRVGLEAVAIAVLGPLQIRAIAVEPGAIRRVWRRITWSTTASESRDVLIGSGQDPKAHEFLEAAVDDRALIDRDAAVAETDSGPRRSDRPSSTGAGSSAARTVRSSSRSSP